MSLDDSQDSQVVVDKYVNQFGVGAVRSNLTAVGLVGLLTWTD
jgi:hypothetical protein